MTDIPPKWAMEKARGIVAKRCPTTSLSDLVIKGAFDNAEPDIRDIARALAAEREAATMAERQWLNAMPKSWELTCENEDRSDVSTDLVWKVYTVHGGLNDREWSLLGTGDTPYNALSAAFLAAAIRAGEPA